MKKSTKPKSRNKYFAAYREANRNKIREYNREWMRNYRKQQKNQAA